MSLVESVHCVQQNKSPVLKRGLPWFLVWPFFYLLAKPIFRWCEENSQNGRLGLLSMTLFSSVFLLLILTVFIVKRRNGNMIQDHEKTILWNAYIFEHFKTLLVLGQTHSFTLHLSFQVSVNMCLLLWIIWLIRQILIWIELVLDWATWERIPEKLRVFF